MSPTYPDSLARKSMETRDCDNKRRSGGVVLVEEALSVREVRRAPCCAEEREAAESADIARIRKSATVRLDLSVFDSV